MNLKEIENKWHLENIKYILRLYTKGKRTVDLINTNIGKYILKAFPVERGEHIIKRYTHALDYIGSKAIKLAPKIYPNHEKRLFSRIDNQYIYIMEYIKGRQLEETIEDEFKLGERSAILHSYHDYDVSSCLDFKERIYNMKRRFFEYSFKKEYDDIVNSLPNFNAYKQTFIHTDIGPHNALMDKEGNVIFVDFDDAGMGSPYIDIGYPLITQFVKFNKQTKKIKYDFENAKAFYKGYFSKTHMSLYEKKLIFDGAVFMQLMYMPVFGPKAVEDMWHILKFGIDNKDRLMSAIL